MGCRSIRRSPEAIRFSVTRLRETGQERLPRGETMSRSYWIIITLLLAVSTCGLSGCASAPFCGTSSCEVCGGCETGCDACSGGGWGWNWGGFGWPSYLNWASKEARFWSRFRSNAIPEALPLGVVPRAHYQAMETNGEAVDFILYRHDFVLQTAELT